MKLTRTQLTTAQSARKAELENIIATELAGFYRCGDALMEINNDRLYLEEYDTFDEYCREKWGMTPRRGYQLIEAAEIVKRCEPVVHIPNERAARPMAGLPPKEQLKVAKVLAKSTEKLTAKSVAQAVSQVRGGLASTLAQARAEAPEPTADESDAVTKIERWYAGERQRLNEYPMATPERVVQLILRLLRGVAALLACLPGFAASLVWDPNAAADQVVEYRVYFNGQTNGVTTTTNRLLLTNLMAGQTYVMRVTALNAMGLESDPSDTVHFTPAQGIPPGPLVTTNTLTRGLNTWTISLAWQPVARSYAVSSYWITVNQNGERYSIMDTTNFQATLTIPARSPTTIYLQASNYLSLSSSTPIATYSQPGRISTAKLTLP